MGFKQIHFFVSIGVWFLQKICAGRNAGNNNNMKQSSTNSVSGVELTSTVDAGAPPCNISGIGDIRTSWIGQKGVAEMQEKAAKEQESSRSKTIAQEVKHLAGICIKAFKVAGLQNTQVPEIKAAPSMCQSYVPSTGLNKNLHWA